MNAPDLGRVGCLVPGCRRTFKRDSAEEYEIVCGKHWRLAPRAMRADVTRVGRLFKRKDTPALRALYDRHWQRVKAEILAAAAGEITDSSLASFVRTL